MDKGYWTYSESEHEVDSSKQYETKQKAIEAANEDLAETTTEYENPANGELFTATYYVFYVEEIEAEYRHYHGDLKEHGLTGRELL